MRVFMILCWMTIPVLAWAYHLGPGQQKLQLDDAQALINQASLAAKGAEWEMASSLYSEALAKLPNDLPSDSYAVRLELAKAQMNSKQLPEARVAFESLLDELQNDSAADPKLVDDARRSLASSQYYMTWLMRLEGEPADVWELEIDGARQQYKLLAESANEAGNTDAFAACQHDLEAAIRLARMDLSDLQALKIPKQCSGCCSCNGKKPNRIVKKKSDKKSSGAGLSKLPDGSGA